MGNRGGPGHNRADSLRSLEALKEYNRLADKLPQDAAFRAMDRAEATWRGIYREDILMARADIQREVINRNLGLPEPFPASPSRPPKYVFRVGRRDHVKSTIPFSAMYAAAHFLKIITDDGIKWVNHNTITLVESGYQVSSDELEDVIEYKLRGKEREWELPEPYLTQAKEIATGVRVKREHGK